VWFPETDGEEERAVLDFTEHAHGLGGDAAVPSHCAPPTPAVTTVV